MLSVLLLILLSPVITLISLLNYIFNGRPIFFWQARAGLNGKIFTLYKFRTMNDLRDENGRLLPDQQRLTLFGAFLRRTQMDEIPQLVNVLKRDMSLIGPRPLLQRYLTLYSPEQARRHEVLPGITGWAQVHGGKTLTWEEKFNFDIWYVDHVSFGVDLQIILMTFGAVLKHTVSASQDWSAMEFTGTDEQS